MAQPENTTQFKVTYHTAGEDDAGQRLDNYLARVLKGVPRSMIYRILRRGEVRVNKGRVSPSYKLQAGDEIRVPPVRVSTGPVTIPSSNLQLVQDLKERILFENELLLVVDKPAGLAAHGGSGIEFGLIEAMRALYPNERFLELAHRLDRETSGALIICKRRSALRNLHEQFRNRVVKKRYLTLVPGKWDRRVNLINAPLVRNELRSGERMVEVNFKEGAPSSTGYDIVESFGESATLMAAMPHTGRTHQIRVHCAYVKHPVGGDDKYGSKEFNAWLKSHGLHRMFLHAFRISFIDPASGRQVKVEAPLPPELEQILTQLRTLQASEQPTGVQ
ncbi:MAG TPA: 23S rRNA pseudouridine(955/2504/2580) synthase RluC [Candidatus Anaerobiospirillum stercoravium]|nr:23S rRNA pseudouridine(955/2504/2580) synthase RluC [Candidatus Anaerobiospirillum stercoravium]